MFARFLGLAAGLLSATIALTSPSEAYIQQIVIDSVNTANYNPVPMGSSTPGPTVNYTIYTGRIFGVLPSNAQNNVVQDLNLAAPVGTSTNPKYSYVAVFHIITPTNPAQRNGLLDYWVVNRGIIQMPDGSGNLANMVQGITYVESGWQGDVLQLCSGAPNQLPASNYPCVDISNPTPGYGPGGGGYGTPTSTFPFFQAPTGMQNYVIQVPVATTDGNPPNGSNNITGPVYGQINKGTTGTTGQLIQYFTAWAPYWPATFNTTQVQFWSDQQQTDYGINTGVTPIASTQWEWSYCPNGKNGAGYIPNDPFWICLLNGAAFNPNQVYEMVYNAVNPLVQGVGFAATRDLASFLRYGTTAPGGGSNPIAGTVTKAMLTGQSQSGAFTRTFIFFGFNQDESGRKVFDGAYPDRAGRILWMNERFEQVNVLTSVFLPGQEAPVWWVDYPNQARNLPPNSILHRCTATNTCPQIMETWDSNTFYAEKAAADYVGFCSPCSTDIPLPPNDGSTNHVYRYFVPGTKHGGGAGGFNWAAPGTLAPSSGALYPADPMSEQEAFRALNYAFYQLLLNGTPMPPSFGGPGGTYPSLASGELAPATNQAAAGFPNNIPGFPYGGSQAWPSFVYNYGTGVNYDQETGITSIWPPQILAVNTPYVPTTNSDGNENTGGVAPVLLQAPLGTYIGWNIYSSYNGCTGLCGYAGQQAQLAGSYWPFWDTKANRLANNDPRPSLEERYGTHVGYDCLVTQIATREVTKRFLLQSDANNLISQATASTSILPAPFVPTTADVALSHNVLCGLTSTHDFSGDYKSDILWRDSGGNVGMWLMNGSSIAQTAVLGNVSANWSIVGQRDFNGDGSADILWRDTSGNVGMWLMNGTHIQSTAVLGNIPTTWSVAATGDFNGDGKADIVWRDTSGNVGLWLMNGTSIQQTAVLGNVSTNWVIAGADNHGNIFWRNSVTGDVGMWKVSGTTIAQTVDFGSVPLSWTIAGTGDFDGNGSTDILWRDTSGDVGIWLLNGMQIQSTAVLGNEPLKWTIAQTGDYAGADTSDILWTDNASNVGVWFMNGTTITSTMVYGNVGTSWAAQTQGSD